MVVVPAVVVVVAKALMGEAALINIVVEVEVTVIGMRTGVLSDTLPDVGMIVATAIVIDFEFGVSVYSVDVLSGVAVDMLAGGIIGFEPVSNALDVFADVNAYAFAAMGTDMESTVPTPLE